MMAEQYINGEVADTWLRNFWIDRLMNEVRSAPLEGEDTAPAPPPEETEPASNEENSIADAADPSESSPPPQQ